MLHIGKGKLVNGHGVEFKLPLEFITERIAFLARTGAGKSGGMRVLAEEMIAAKQFLVFLDPKGDAWGIRSKYPVLIMGGEHGDVPLEAAGGRIVADFLVKERISTVLDVSSFGEAEMVRFVADFGEQFYRTNREAMHLFIDEADEFAPQSGYNIQQAKCLGAIQRLQRRGRGRGIGLTLATQRSAVINKSVLTQAGTLIAMQAIGPQDLEAVDFWLKYAATKEARNEIMSALPGLEPREAFVYSPQHLGMAPVRIKFRAFHSFDSMRTPRPGEARAAPKSLADVDLSAVQRDMAATIEKAKADDPAALRSQIAELKRGLAKKPGAAPAERVEVIKEVAAGPTTQEVSMMLQGVCDRTEKFFREQCADAVTGLPWGRKRPAVAVVQPARVSLGTGRPVAHDAGGPLPGGEGKRAAGPAAPQKSALQRVIEENHTYQGVGQLDKGERSTLIALVQYPTGLTREQLTVLTGYKRSSRDRNIQHLCAKGYAAVEDVIVSTPAGREALGPEFQPLPTGQALRDYWMQRLPEGERKILSALMDIYPRSIPRAALDESSGYKRSTRDKIVQHLTSKELVECIGSEVKATGNLFNE